jgi:hypothetical protein
MQRPFEAIDVTLVAKLLLRCYFRRQLAIALAL